MNNNNKPNLLLLWCQIKGLDLAFGFILYSLLAFYQIPNDSKIQEHNPQPTFKQTLVQE